MTWSKAGQIVWHDLFTSDRERSMEFYKRVANWTYQVERATDFAWGGGEKEFVLALSGDEAGAGFAETPSHQENGWIAYIEVPDVDAAVQRVDALGGSIMRQPFEVPGVGRNALVRDPLGALLGISLSRHSYPVPRRQFGPDVYVSHGDDFPELFYAELFGWRVSPEQRMEGRNIHGPSGNLVAVRHSATWPSGAKAAWVPCIKATPVSDGRRVAEANGARPAFEDVNKTVQVKTIILLDPNGAPFALDVEQTSIF
ncbi:VOC family protein [Aliiroseovarius sp. S2029]|uniref:VOC family protein n=1 Tax=Aliiroseovarius sp. S2029 TaxID=2936988 RepID=UPI0020BF58BF|nr:VOC family protein [Aliiroseovarius sp. S2029]MCK8485444.1 VOC family protein [Aliiroseovarius sp. S2029]